MLTPSLTVARPRVLEQRKWVWIENAGNCERASVSLELWWTVKGSGHTDFAGSDAGIFGTDAGH
jgi:hypothetical protein